MNNINTINKCDYNHKISNKRKNLGYALMLAGLFNMSSPTYAQSNTSTVTTEQVNPTNIDNYNGIELPAVYQERVDDFLKNNKVMKDEGTRAFTLDFVLKEMEKDWKISKENQLLFIRHSIYKQVTDTYLFDGQDGDPQKIAEFGDRAVSTRIRACGQKYKDGVLAYLNQRSADAQQRSADAQQRSADAQQRSADYDRRIAEARQQSADYDRRIAEARQQSAEAIRETMKADSLGLKELVKYYNLCMKNPEANDEDEILSVRNAAKEIIKNCKKYGINYEDVMMKEIKKTDRLNDTDAKEKVDMILMWVEGPDFADNREKGREPSTNRYEIMGNDSKPDSI